MKAQNIFQRGLFPSCCRWNIHRSVLIPRELPCPEKVLFAPLDVVLSFSVSIEKKENKIQKKKNLNAKQMWYKWKGLQIQIQSFTEKSLGYLRVNFQESSWNYWLKFPQVFYISTALSHSFLTEINGYN